MTQQFSYRKSTWVKNIKNNQIKLPSKLNPAFGLNSYFISSKCPEHVHTLHDISLYNHSWLWNDTLLLFSEHSFVDTECNMKYVIMHPKKCWVKYKPVLGKIWTNPATGLFWPSVWVTTQKGQTFNPKQPCCWVCPYFTQHWVVFNPAFLECAPLVYTVNHIRAIHTEPCISGRFWPLKWHTCVPINMNSPICNNRY